MRTQYSTPENCTQNTGEPESIDPTNMGFNMISRARWIRKTHSAESIVYKAGGNRCQANLLQGRTSTKL